MEFEEISSFLEIAEKNLSSCWQLDDLSDLAYRRFPDSILLDRNFLLRADINTLWVRWFLESICDLDSFLDQESRLAYPHLVKKVESQVRKIFPRISKADQRRLIPQVSRLLSNELKRRKVRSRTAPDSVTRHFLWSISGNEPRCWICGYKFTDLAKQNFLEGDNCDLPLPEFIDYMKPSGLRVRDIRVEIDHVMPHSKGGQEGDNLKLACGWCNNSKSSRLSIYDVEAVSRKFYHPKFGQTTIPQPFWIVRLLSIRGKCEHPDGCNQTTDNGELTVTLKNPEGTSNPTNLRVVCLNHDPLGSARLVSRHYFRLLSRSG